MKPTGTQETVRWNISYNMPYYYLVVAATNSTITLLLLCSFQLPPATSHQPSHHSSVLDLESPD